MKIEDIQLLESESSSEELTFSSLEDTSDTEINEEFSPLLKALLHNSQDNSVSSLEL